MSSSITLNENRTQQTLRYWSNTGPIPVQYWNSFWVLAQYRPNTWLILGQYGFVCTCPVLAKYISSSIGPAHDLFRSNTAIVSQYWPSADPVLG